MKYRFSNSEDTKRIKSEIEDNFATYGTVQTKALKVTDFQENEPQLKDMQKGDVLYYYDGANYWEYKRISNVLIKTQATTV